LSKEDPISPEQLETIERFLHNKMMPEERQVFIARLSSNELLKKNVDEMQLVLLGIEEASVKEKLVGFHNSLPKSAAPKQAVVKALRLKSWLAAASVLLIVSVGSWLIFSNPGDNESLFKAYFHPDPGLVSTMSLSENYLFDRAMVDYKTGNFKAAIKTWDSLQRIQPANDTLNYFLGTASLSNNELDNAIRYLQNVAAMPASVFSKDANWYLGLAYLKKGDRKEAIYYIERSDHEDKAALLQRLK
jgi:tetratricopeptide (TPR) repeat protein